VTQADQNPSGRRLCVARFHLRGANFAIYDAAMALTSHSVGRRILSASRDTLSKMTGYGQRTVGFARVRLVESGWLKPLTPGWQDDQRKTGAAGRFRTPRFEIVSHDEWAATNPGKCSTVVLTTDHGNNVHAKTEYGQTRSAETAITDHGQTTDTDHGPTDHNALVLSSKNKPKRVRSADALPSSGRDFENPKITERIKEFIDSWAKRYQKVYAGTPTISWPREMKRLRPIFEKNSNQVIQSAAEGYLTERSDFTAGHPIGTFVSQFDRWRALGSCNETQDCTDEDDVENDRPPDWEETQRKIAEEKARKARAIAS
jgi:hypothetical protein